MDELKLKARIVRNENGSVDFYFSDDFNETHAKNVNEYLANAKEVELARIESANKLSMEQIKTILNSEGSIFGNK